MSAALFVDLPNFYSHLLSSNIEEPRLLRDYFLEWLDFDRLAERLCGQTSSVWVFYSGRRFGPSSNRIQGELLEKYIERINNTPGVTARDVNIPGPQREPATYHCKNCGHEGVAQWESEKGIDSSLTVHLFDTSESWDVAFLLSGDADFVPVVSSLRRKGKIVIGVGFSDASTALKRECYQYIDLGKDFLNDDVLAYLLFRPNGIISKWISEDVIPSNDNRYSPTGVNITAEWQTTQIVLNTKKWISGSEKYYPVYLTRSGSMELSNRGQYIEYIRTRFANNLIVDNPNDGMYQIGINSMNWSGISRRIDALVASLRGGRFYDGLAADTGYSVKYQYNDDTQSYELVTI